MINFLDIHQNRINIFDSFFLAFQVSSLVQVVGIILCLHGATRISHRAQAIASIASRWHAILTCSSNDTSHHRSLNSVGSLEVLNTLNSLVINYSESDVESVDYIGMPSNTQLASYLSSYHRRQAFGMDSYISISFVFYLLLTN